MTVTVGSRTFEPNAAAGKGWIIQTTLKPKTFALLTHLSVRVKCAAVLFDLTEASV